MSKLNVLFMQSQSYYGADSLIHGLIMQYFDRSRIQVHVAVNPGTPREPSPSLQALRKIPNVSIRPTHFGTSVNFRSKLQIAADTAFGSIPATMSLAGLVRYARMHKIDIVHGTEKPRDAFYGVILARMIGAKSVVHLHVNVDHSWMSPLTQWAMKRADALIGVSDATAQSAIAAGYDPKRVFSVLNSLDLTHWDANTDGSEVRREFGLAPETPVLAAVSRLFPWKGHGELLSALKIVAASRPDVRLLIVGEDEVRATPGAKSYVAELKQRVKWLGLEEQVIFTGFRRDVVKIMAASDMYCMPSFEEPFGMVFLEAMAVRKPVIALHSGGVPQIVEHGQTGLLSQPYDIGQLAENILTLVNNPQLRQQMGISGRMRAEEHFTPQRLANDIEQVYRRILGQRVAEPVSMELTNV